MKNLHIVLFVRFFYFVFLSPIKTRIVRDLVPLVCCYLPFYRVRSHVTDSHMQETVLYISAEVSVELGRSVHMNFNLDNVEELTEFIDGLVVPSEENLVTEGSQTGASGRTLFLGCFNLCTADMFIQLEAPPVLAKPKLLGSVLGIEAKASLELDLQGRRLRNSGILRIWRFRWSFIARETETSGRNGEKGVEKFPPPPLLSG